jgi:hypothetical protein
VLASAWDNAAELIEPVNVRAASRWIAEQASTWATDLDDPADWKTRRRWWRRSRRRSQVASALARGVKRDA